MKNFKKLNKKGFTLVELLAIIVILAIILVVTVPAVFSAIDNSRKMSLENSAKGLAKWINDTLVSEQIQVQDVDPTKTLAYELSGVGDSWSCIGSTGRIAKEISSADYVIGGTAPTGSAQTPVVTDDNNCSAVRYNKDTSSYEVVLVALSGGKLYTVNGLKEGQSQMWATNTNIKSFD